MILTGGSAPRKTMSRAKPWPRRWAGPGLQPGICDAIEERFRRLQRKMAEINKRQAYVVEGAEALPNTNGTAPAQWIAERRPRCHPAARAARRIEAMFTERMRPALDANCCPRR